MSDKIHNIPAVKISRDEVVAILGDDIATELTVHRDGFFTYTARNGRWTATDTAVAMIRLLVDAAEASGMLIEYIWDLEKGGHYDRETLIRFGLMVGTPECVDMPVFAVGDTVTYRVDRHRDNWQVGEVIALYLTRKTHGAIEDQGYEWTYILAIDGYTRSNWGQGRRVAAKVTKLESDLVLIRNENDTPYALPTAEITLKLAGKLLHVALEEKDFLDTLKALIVENMMSDDRVTTTSDATEQINQAIPVVTDWFKQLIDMMVDPAKRDVMGKALDRRVSDNAADEWVKSHTAVRMMTPPSQVNQD